MTFDQGRWRDVEAERESGHRGADGRGAPAPLLVGGKWCDLTGTINHDGPFKPGTGSLMLFTASPQGYSSRGHEPAGPRSGECRSGQGRPGEGAIMGRGQWV